MKRSGRRKKAPCWSCRRGAVSKTVMFADIIRRAFPRRSLVLAHRRELVYQARDKIAKMTGWRVDVEMGESRAEMGCMFGGPRVVVSSIQTQASGGDGGGRMTRFDPRLFGVLVCDESHHSVSPQWRRVLDWFVQGNPDIRILGVTATPDRADEEALGQVYESVAFDYEVVNAIDDGWLVPVVQRMVHVEGLDFSGCRTTAGDLNGADLAKVMEYEATLQRVVSPSIDIIGNRRTLVFASSVNHAERMAEMFNRHRPGMAGWVCGETPADERARLLRDFSTGAVQVVCNCNVLTEGFDNPGVEVVIMARPTKSRSLYSQMCGRGMRPCDEIAHTLNDYTLPEQRRSLIAESTKPIVEIVDYVGNSGQHKLMTSVDILGGKVSDRVIELATAKLAECPGGMRVDKAVALAKEEAEAEAQRRAQEEEEQKKRDAAQRAKLLAKAKFQTSTVDPFDALDIRPMKHNPKPADQLSEKASMFLLRQGINPESMPVHQAKQLMRQLLMRMKNGMATYGQCKILSKRGLPTNITREAASKLIDEIAQREGWQKRGK